MGYHPIPDPDSPFRRDRFLSTTGADGDPDRRVIACNLTEGITEASVGALAYVLRLNPGGANDRIVLLLRSRGGRWIEKWESMRRLGNFRFKTIPPAHPLYGRLDLADRFGDEALQRLQEAGARLR